MSMTPESAIVCVKMMFAFWANAHGLNVAEMEEAKDLAVEALRAYPPAHIDREAWEPCYSCEPQLLMMGNNYCGNCGRPLTEEAWDELEKRMGARTGDKRTSC